MKKFTLVCLLAVIAIFVHSQSPSAFNYQAVLRDASGNIRTNANITVRVDIIQTSATGTSVYAETFAATTNVFGLINLQVGNGTVVSGTFNTIDWSADLYFIEITVDGTVMSTSQMLSVPYALYAAKAGNSFSGVYTDLTGKPTLANVATSGSYNDLLNKPSFSETDPIYNVSVAKAIKASDTTRWSAKSNFNGDYKTLTNKPAFADDNNMNYALGNNTFPSNTSGNRNTAMGRNAMLYNTTGGYNAAAGFNALLYNTAGSFNSAFGAEALCKNTSGTRNTAIGTDALYENTTGTDNTACGNVTLFFNTTGKYNTSIGAYSLYNNTTAGGSVAVGYQALNKNTTAGYNVAVGYDAMYSNQTGHANTAIGTKALRNNVIGRWNTAIGDSALLTANTDKNTAVGYKALNTATGWDNTAIGYSALIQNTGGFDNVAIGADALNVNTSGNGNTAIGKNTLTGCATGNNNTAIGSRADILGNFSNATAIGYFALADANNKVVIGNSDVTIIGGKVNWSLTSDSRLKENIVYNNTLGLNFISKLQTATYNYKSDKAKSQYNGLVAQDVQKILSDLGMGFSGLVVEDNPEKYLRLSYAEFVIPLINSVQELNKKNQELQQKNESLEATINAMKADLEMLKKSMQK